MMQSLVQHDAPVIDLGVDLLAVYKRCLFHLDGRVPEFTELYEEYSALYLEARIKEANGLNISRIQAELHDLHMEHGREVFSIENGFNGEQYGIPREAILFNALVESQLFFAFKGNLYNHPVAEVW